ncbi:BTB/POZ domain-containing protein [Thalictrum thalictroides]|uniref:BTB/POZ domain-containing protein n=1 Tax=Thalictrum thalictroides TaxID=46969 RepID=A0A7J6XBJ6_THATH|nr:BTB/POZ domain-containing protein [Thalictrum thalictroides]
MRGWKDLELVETIYEEEDHDDIENYSSSNSSSLSPSLTPSPPTPLQSIAKTWSLATGIQTDVVIYVQDQSFHLHKDSLIAKSGYLKRRLTDSNEITISPPLNITAETFSSVVDYCYSFQIVITPFNVAALKVAVELLDITEDNGNGVNNLRKKTESYFEQAVSVNREYAIIVLRSCLSLLPVAESASMVSRCIEALTLTHHGVSENVNGWVDEIMSLTTEDFQLIADSMHEQFSDNHDLLYRIADLYLQEHTGKITEEEKTRICSSVDCNKLSPHLIMHAVQNPRMPLRFIVRAMLVEQLNTRCTIISTTTSAVNNRQPRHNPQHNNEYNQSMTLGAMLQRDATFRQVAQLKATMEATSSKIETLEKDLMRMKKVLDSSKKKQRESSDSGRSASFRFSSERKIEKEDRGPNSTSLRFSDKRERGVLSLSPSSSEISMNESVILKREKSFGWKLMNGLKTALRMSPTSKHDSKSSISSKVDGNGLRDVEEDGAIIVYKEERPSHLRSHSLA